MSLSTLKKSISSIAPFIGSLIGGPLGASAGKVIGKILTGKDNASDEEIEESLKNISPDKLVEIKLADLEYKKKLAEIGLDEKKIILMDVANARKKEILTGDKMPAILSVFLTLGFFGILILIIFYPVQKNAEAVIDIMLGSLGTAWISVITYYFGSSYGSLRKTEIMKNNN